MYTHTKKTRVDPPISPPPRHPTGDWPDCYQVNKYAKGFHDAAKSPMDIVKHFKARGSGAPRCTTHNQTTSPTD